MKRFFSFSLAIYIFALSIFSVSFRSEAETPDYLWLGYPSLFETLYNDGEFDWSAYSDSVKSQLISLVCDVMFSVGYVPYFTSSLNFLLDSYDAYSDISDFFQQVLTFDSSNNTIDITGEGRRIVKNACDRTFIQNGDYILYKSVPITNNLLYFSGTSSYITLSNLSLFTEWLEDVNNDYFIFFRGNFVTWSQNYLSLLATTSSSSIYLVPKTSIFYGHSTNSNSYYKLSDNVSGQNAIEFIQGSVLGYSSLDVRGSSKYITFNSLISALNQGVSPSYTTYDTALFYPYNNTYGCINVPKLYNNNNIPFVFSDGSYSYWFVSYNSEPEIIQIFKSKNAYLASIDEVPSYFVGDTYYSYDYSSNNTTTIGSQTIYDNCPNYNNVYNYYGDYFAENGSLPSQTIVYEYINNYYYDSNNGSGGDNGGSGGDNGGGIFDWLGSLGSVLGSLISGLGNLIVNLLDSVVDVFGNLATVLPESMGTFFSTFFEWLPPEWVSLITLSLTLGIVFGLVRIVRG